MSSILAAPRSWRVTVEDVPIRILDDISISESMANLTTVVEFGLAQRGSSLPIKGDSVLVEWIDQTASTSTVMFLGEVDAVEVESGPWSYRCRCVDQLSKLRRVKSGSDMDLSGLTDGEAWKAVANYCGITYDDGDIADMGYVLGVRAPILWLADGQTPGSSIIKELDDTFRCNTIAIGNGRVVRHAYDPFPTTGTFSYATYVRGTSIRLQGLHRTRGGSDQIQNVWNITGAVIESEDGSCSTTPWAKAVDGNAELGSRRVRVSEQSYSSDLIQDESLAMAIATWKMGETNRVSDTGSATIFHSTGIHPGTIIGLIDTTPGIDAETERWCLVTSTERAGFGMTMELTTGPAGEVGTLTHGMNLVCNDDSGDGGGADDGFPDFPDPGEFPTPGDDVWDPGDDPLPDLEVDDDSELPVEPEEPVICSEFTSDPLFLEGVFVQSYWRPLAALTWEWVTPDGSSPVDGDVLVMRLTGGSGAVIFSTNQDVLTQVPEEDVVYPAASSVSFCLDVAVCGANTVVDFGLVRADTGGDFNAFVEWTAEPDGLVVTDALAHTRKFTGRIVIPNGSAVTNLDHTPSSISGGALGRNTGRNFPFPGPADGLTTSGPGTNPEDYDFMNLCVSFDLSGEYQDGFVYGDGGEGHNTSEVCLTPSCVGGALHYTPNSRDFKIKVSARNADWLTGDCPPLQIFAADVSTECVPNPDYVDPWDREDEGP